MTVKTTRTLMTTKPTVEELREFLADLPADTPVEIEVQRGDPLDQREAGYRCVTLKVTL